MAADKYNFDPRVNLLGFTGELDSRHNRHADIGQNQIDPLLLHCFERIKAVISRCSDLQVQSAAQHPAAQPLEVDCLVVDK
ncbi:hypothetical protein D3C74_377380 [compost metagenome]